MPQSLSKVILHIVFSTKNREPWLKSNVRPRAHAYLATVCRDLGAELVRVGGVVDHVHIVTTLPRTVSQAQLVEQIKKASSKWIKALMLGIAAFFGNAATARFQLARANLMPCCNTSRRSESIIARGRFRRNTASCFTGMALISMSGTFGIEKPRQIETRFQRLVICG